METNLNNIWQKCTWQNLRKKLYATNVRFIRWESQSLLQVSKWDLIFFQFNNETIEPSRFRQLLQSQYELLLPTLASFYFHDRSLLMSRRNIIIFYPFSLTYLVRWAPSVRAPEISLACATLHGSRCRFHVNMGFSDDDRILAVTSNICCNTATGTCLI